MKKVNIITALLVVFLATSCRLPVRSGSAAQATDIANGYYMGATEGAKTAVYEFKMALTQTAVQEKATTPKPYSFWDYSYDSSQTPPPSESYMSRTATLSGRDWIWYQLEPGADPASGEGQFREGAEVTIVQESYNSYGVKLVGWVANSDMQSGGAGVNDVLTCLYHTWDHFEAMNLCHAHFYATQPLDLEDESSVFAIAQSGLSVNVLEHRDLVSRVELTSLVWVDSSYIH